MGPQLTLRPDEVVDGAFALVPEVFVFDVLDFGVLSALFLRIEPDLLRGLPFPFDACFFFPPFLLLLLLVLMPDRDMSGEVNEMLSVPPDGLRPRGADLPAGLPPRE